MRGTWQEPSSAIRTAPILLFILSVLLLLILLLLFDGRVVLPVEVYPTYESPSPLARGHHRKGPRVFSLFFLFRFRLFEL